MLTLNDVGKLSSTPIEYLVSRLVIELRPWRDEKASEFESFLNEAYAERVAEKLNVREW